VKGLRILLAVAALVACGKVGPPVPPEDRVPQPVHDLRAVIQDGAVALAWTNPTRRADNTRLRDLVTARVYRVEDEGIGDPKPALLMRRRITGYTEVARIDLLPSRQDPSAPGAPVVDGNRVHVEDRGGLAYGRRYTYVVLTEDGQRRLSPPSPRASVIFIAAPQAPPRVTAVAGEREVRLEWEPPPRFADGTPVRGPLAYEILRSVEATGALQSVSPTPVSAPRFVDQNLENDRTYYYAVRALRHEETTLARGPASTPVAATPRDMTPPAPPAQLVAAPAPEGVRLSWKPSADADVAIYVVYRATGTGVYARVGSSQAPLTTFLDRNPGQGTYRYVVTALDSGAQPNESGRSNEVTVTLP
jgi:predicted small lipoprotein YifL